MMHAYAPCYAPSFNESCMCPPCPCRYFYPFTAPITQMIVLHAPNPWGAAHGTIPAIIFAYLDSTRRTVSTTVTNTTTNITTTVNTTRTTTKLDFAICGNAEYASAFLYPGLYPLPPTPVTLQASYSNPLSEQLPLRFLGSFDGKCSIMGRGYLGGDPYQLSRNHLKVTTKACFALRECKHGGLSAGTGGFRGAACAGWGTEGLCSGCSDTSSLCQHALVLPCGQQSVKPCICASTLCRVWPTCTYMYSLHLGPTPNNSLSVCPVPAATKFLNLPLPKFPPKQRMFANFEAPDTYRPCAYHKHAEKHGAGTSLSCVQNGYTLAVGKYGALNYLEQKGEVVGWKLDEKTGQLSPTTQLEEYEGTEKGEVEVAPGGDAGTPPEAPAPAPVPVPAPKPAPKPVVKAAPEPAPAPASKPAAKPAAKPLLAAAKLAGRAAAKLAARASTQQ